jgi:hypothetical protein
MPWTIAFQMVDHLKSKEKRANIEGIGKFLTVIPFHASHLGSLDFSGTAIVLAGNLEIRTLVQMIDFVIFLKQRMAKLASGRHFGTFTGMIDIVSTEILGTAASIALDHRHIARAQMALFCFVFKKHMVNI